MSTLFTIKPDDKISVTVIDESYSFFDNAVSFVSGICSTNLLIDSYLSEAIPYQDGHYLYFEGRKKATNKVYYLKPWEFYREIIDNKWPKQLNLYHKHKDFEDQEQETENSINGFAGVFLSLGQASYIQFWELIKENIKTYHNPQIKNWDSIFQFGWIIRNALAHNFKITINDPFYEDISWNGLSYGYSKNDTDISEEIMFLELIILMKDIEDHLRKHITKPKLH